MSLIIRGVAILGAVLGIARGHAQMPLVAVGAENEYADVIAQIGGRDVR